MLGHLAGELAGDRIPVIDGLAVRPTEDQLKAVGAGAASSGAVALFHITGVTPEAPTLDAVFGGRAPAETHIVGMPELRVARAELDHRNRRGARHGAPRQPALLAGRVPAAHGAARQGPGTRECVPGDDQPDRRGAGGTAGLLAPLRRFGGQITVDTCPLATPMLPPEIRTLMTNSAKYAYYVPGLLGTQVIYGSLADCVRSAVEGRVVRDETLWDSRT